MENERGPFQSKLGLSPEMGFKFAEGCLCIYFELSGHWIERKLNGSLESMEFYVKNRKAKASSKIKSKYIIPFTKMESLELGYDNKSVFVKKASVFGKRNPFLSSSIIWLEDHSFRVCRVVC